MLRVGSLDPGSLGCAINATRAMAFAEVLNHRLLLQYAYYTYWLVAGHPYLTHYHSIYGTVHRALNSLISRLSQVSKHLCSVRFGDPGIVA